MDHAVFLVLGVAAIIDVAGPCTSADQGLYIGIGGRFIDDGIQ